MKRNRHLRLSLFTVPELSIGRAPLTPQNSQFDPRRLTYLEGMVDYLNGLLENLRKSHSQSEALFHLEKFLAQLPCSELVKIRTLLAGGFPHHFKAFTGSLRKGALATS